MYMLCIDVEVYGLQMYIYKYLHIVKSLVKTMILAISPFKMNRFHLNQSSWIAISHHPSTFLIWSSPYLAWNNQLPHALAFFIRLRRGTVLVGFSACCLLIGLRTCYLLIGFRGCCLLIGFWGHLPENESRKSWWNSMSWSGFKKKDTLYIYIDLLTLVPTELRFFLSKLASCIPWWRSFTFETWKFGSPALKASSVLGL